MNRIYLEYHDEKQNKHRFYQLFIVPTLFDDWSLVPVNGAALAVQGRLKRTGLKQKHLLIYPAKH